MKKFLTSATASAITLGLACTAFTVSAVEEQQNFIVTGDYISFPSDISADPDIVVSTLNNFRVEYFSGGYGASFIPEENGYFVVSIVQNYNESIINTASGSHVHYFYPTVQTYSVIKNDEEIIVWNTGLDYSGYNEETVKELSKSEDIVCSDYYEEIDDCFNGSYYSLVNGYMPSGCYFTYFDYAYETADKKDRSQFLIPASYSPLDEIPFEIIGNSELIEMGYASSGIFCDDIFNYYVYAPTGNGETEISYLKTDVDSFEDEFIVISAENGQYIPHIETGKRYYQHEPDGDVNGDGETGIADMVLLQKYLLASSNLTASQLIAADMNADGKVDVYDMIMMRKIFAE